MSVLYCLSSYRKNCGFIPVNHSSLTLSMPNTQNEVSVFPCISLYGLRIVSYSISLFKGSNIQKSFFEGSQATEANLLPNPLLLIIFQDVLTVFFSESFLPGVKFPSRNIKYFHSCSFLQICPCVFQKAWII